VIKGVGVKTVTVFVSSYPAIRIFTRKDKYNKNLIDWLR